MWLFSIVGTIDLINAYYEGNQLGFTLGLQGALVVVRQAAGELRRTRHPTTVAAE